MTQTNIECSGSGASNTNSASTGGYYDTSSSSTRLSSSSTVPSSTDLTTHNDLNNTKAQFDKPIPPIPESRPSFSLSAGSRTFSFGRKAFSSNKPPAQPKPSKAPALPLPDSSAESTQDSLESRDRALTESSYASTATPPKLEDSLVGNSSFSDLFSNFGKRKSQIDFTESPLPSPKLVVSSASLSSQDSSPTNCETG